jgi:citrate lyase subunit beta/citryl-CoA lyase
MGPALLFCPADRPERFTKAAERADAVILDLEDAVRAEGKSAARENVLASDLDPETVIVRVNAPGTEDFRADVAMLGRSPFRTVMVAKSEDPAGFAPFDDTFSLIALCETARGVQAADRLAAHGQVVAMMWGAEDLVASLGGTSSRRDDGGYRDIARYARARVLLEAGARGKAAIDAVHIDLEDDDGMEREARDAAASGFRATACIHPRQVEVVRRAYRPAEEIVDWARRVLAAAESERGVFGFEGRMVDEPVLRHARSVIARSR